MSKLALYTGIKTRLNAIDGIEYVGLWNNQPNREKVNHAFNYPAIFIEFLPSNYSNFLQGVQFYSMVVRLHLCFESYKDDDTTIITLQRTVAHAMRYAQYSYFNKLSLIGKEQNFDHDQVQIYTQDYQTSGKDYGADNRPTVEASLVPSITGDIVASLEDRIYGTDTDQGGSELILFNGLKADLETIPGLHVALWNNQPKNEKREHAFNYPACFIEFKQSENTDLLEAAQLVALTVRVHICFDSAKDEDTDILTLVDSVFAKVHYKQYGYFTKLLRSNEEQDFDHDSVQIYIQDYTTVGKEYQTTDQVDTTITILEINPEEVPVIGFLETEYGQDILQETDDNILL